ncbi:MAG: hypothetical protein EHM85_03320 [Desulfobacteraceae bacterium]|nr:MAG: hypothetical protein EHM85_03320 [Desulfobacteraceae bacterium]
MNIGIVGSRKYQDRQSVINLVNALSADTQVKIITSKCKGVCSWAIEASAERNMKVEIYAPDLKDIRSWFDIPKRYYQRNRELIEACDVLYAFTSRDGLVGGTLFEVAYAVKAGIPTQLRSENGIIQTIYQNQFPFMNPPAFSDNWQAFFRQTFS